jgi:cell shape-determining protein MreC
MYSLKEAAEAVGLSKTAIFKAIKIGKISAVKDTHGHWYIQPAELHRVYAPINLVNGGVNQSLTTHQEELSETQILRLELDNLREQLLETINDLRRRLDKAEDERRSAQEKLSLLLEHKPLATVEQRIEKKGENQLWKKVFKNDKSIK